MLTKAHRKVAKTYLTEVDYETACYQHNWDACCGSYPPVLKACGLYFSQAIIWVKEHPVLTRKDRMGTRVERVGFRWERGKVWQPSRPSYASLFATWPPIDFKVW